jgi:predicted glycoside hydrolase/deacetylase ChbG (UPF0249 family)
VAAGAARQDGEVTAKRFAAPRRIWLVADDYGISPAVNAAIRDLVVRGRLNATSVMVAAPSFDRSEVLPLTMLNIAATRVAIGLHVTLTAPFRPLSADFAPAPRGVFPSLASLMARAALGRLDRAKIAIEIATQFKAFQTAFNRVPDFVDGHQHVQLLPVIGEALLAVTKEAAPRAWVRQCGSALPLLYQLADAKGLLLDRLSRRFRARAAALGIRTNPAFAGTYDFGARLPIGELFPQFLDRLPDGSVVMCHPGTVDDELRRLDPLTDLRAAEYAYFAGEDFAGLLRAQGVALA